LPLPQNNVAIQAKAYPPLQHYSFDAKFSWSSELRHLFSRKFLNICWWPLFKFYQRRFTRSPLFRSCKKLPEFSDLWKTIQKGSFAYNTLFLGLPASRHYSATDLADITTLTLFFGDEFIDGVTSEAGKSFIGQLITSTHDQFYLRKKVSGNTVKLQYRFDLRKLLPPNVLQQVNSKYQVSYQKFYELLQDFLQLMNEHLGKLPFSKAEKVADKITDACNTCFESFLHDVNSRSAHNNISDMPDVLQFHELKTAYMQKKLLELRCILADKDNIMNSVQTAGWLDIMRVIQIYDDIHDVILDDGIQDNIVLTTAFHCFPREWKWFCLNKHLLEQEKQKPLLLSLYMPCSMERCMQMASDKIRIMNWEQQKIMHYLLFKNKYVLYRKKAGENLMAENNFILQFYLHVKDKMAHLPEEAIKSFAINSCIHIRTVRRHVLKKINFSASYRLRYNLLSLSAETKAAIFDSITKK